MNNLCFILPYFGKEPFWFKYFIESAGKNKQYTWFLFTDFNFTHLPENIIHYKLSLIEFNQFVDRQLDIKSKIFDPYKLCDFKPAFGHIFQDYIADFTYWAYCDADIILGNISKFLSDVLESDFDIISPDKSFFPGHFCIFRNNDMVNSLYQKAKNYRSIFESSKNYYFDEFLIEKGLANLRQRKNLVVKVYLKKRLVNQLKQLFPKLKNYHRIISHNNELVDFNSVIKHFSNNEKIKVFQKQLYESDFTFKVEGLRKWNILYEDGHVYNGTKELIYFHFQLSKGLDNFQIKEIGENSFILEAK
jgi:hypothetical protein